MKPAGIPDLLGEAAGRTGSREILQSVHTDPELKADVFDEVEPNSQTPLPRERNDADMQRRRYMWKWAALGISYCHSAAMEIHDRRQPSQPYDRKPRASTDRDSPASIDRRSRASADRQPRPRADEQPTSSRVRRPIRASRDAHRFLR